MTPIALDQYNKIKEKYGWADTVDPGGCYNVIFLTDNQLGGHWETNLSLSWILDLTS